MMAKSRTHQSGSAWAGSSQRAVCQKVTRAACSTQSPETLPTEPPLGGGRGGEGVEWPWNLHCSWPVQEKPLVQSSPRRDTASLPKRIPKVPLTEAAPQTPSPQTSSPAVFCGQVAPAEA